MSYNYQRKTSGQRQIFMIVVGLEKLGGSSMSQLYSKNEATTWTIPNYWDVIALALILAIIVSLALGAKQMLAPYHLGDVMAIHLNPSYLPYYALRTVLRLFIALIFSLLFTFTFGTLAAKNKHAERLVIPMIDILQSVPILSFLSLTITGFIVLFKGSMLGPECAAIFVIFTSQVWNMALSFYQSMRTVPQEFRETARIFQLSAWQCFWRIEVPFAMPGLLWNMMMSMSGSWFFIIASEAVSTANQNITLPGVGSYIALAIAQANYHAIIYAIITMLVVIFLYDQLLFRPLVYWVDRFKAEQDEDITTARSWLVTLFQRTKLMRHSSKWLAVIGDWCLNFPSSIKESHSASSSRRRPLAENTAVILYYLILGATLLAAIVTVVRFVLANITFAECKAVLLLGGFTALRVMTLIALCSIIWVPVGVWIGLRPRVAAVIQPIAQFLAAFPSNLFFPVAAIAIIYFNLSPEIWVAPLMVLGTQWYILFNVIAGASALPKDIKQAAAISQVKGWLWWKRVILPGIAPYFVTGAITAAGGAWNASIVAEVIIWGTTKLKATGLGTYITESFAKGDFVHVVFGTIIMCVFVLTINRLFWRPLYNKAVARYQIE